MTIRLPENPSLSHLKKQAKELHTQMSVADPDLKLAQAQFALAKQYGFASWPKVKAHIEQAEVRRERPENPALKRAIRDLKEGRLCVLFDDEGRENEGDFVAAADKITPEIINQITKLGRGTLCLALEAEQAERLGLTLVNPKRSDSSEPAFLNSVDAAEGVTTGVSAFDRAHTVRVVASRDAKPESIKSPGHVFPLVAAKGGIKERQGHTEGAVELMRLAGLTPAAVICEILKDDGTMARLADVKNLAQELDVAFIQMSELLEKSQ